MEDILSFERGYNPDIEVLSMPKGSYLDAINMMRDEYGNMKVETGTSSVLELGLGRKIVGLKVLGDDIIVASTDDVTSEIGVLNVNDNYTVSVSNTILGFNKSNNVNIESKINYKGERIIYLAGSNIKLRSINLDDLPQEEDFDSITSLFLEYDLPVSKIQDVSTGGNVLSGVYQFAVRLVTGSNNTTAFGPLSEIIPVVIGDESSGRKNIDGADPQTLTNKSINFVVSNIDTSFQYIEPCVVTYVGPANILSIKSLGRREIGNRSEIVLTYSGASDEAESILEEELFLDNTYYESAKYITQKDSTLELAGLTEIEDTYDWQSVANSIVMKYTTKKLEYSEEIVLQKDGDTLWTDISDSNKLDAARGDSWQDIGIIGSTKDYKDPKVCALFRGYRRDEVYSFTFTPIFKGGRRGNAYHIPALTVAEVTALGESTTNLLSVAATASHTYPDGFGTLTNQNVRYHRMPSNVTVPAFTEEFGIQYITALGVEAVIKSSGWESQLDGYIIGRENRVGRETIGAQGFAKDFYSVGNNEYGFVPGFGNFRIRNTNKSDLTDSAQMHKKIFTFHSPDILTNSNISYIPTAIDRICKYSTEIKFADTGSRDRIESNCMISCNPGTYISEKVNLVEGYRYIETISKDPKDNAHASPKNTNLSINVFELKVDYKRTMSCVALKSSSDLPRNREFIEYFVDDDDRERASYKLLSLDPFEFDLYNLIIDRPNFYGDVYDKESMPVSTVLFNAENINPVTGELLGSNKVVFFGGDTFISRYAVVLKTTGPYYGGSSESDQDIPKTNTLVYLMVESNNNYNFRHYNESDGITTGTLPYYPKYKLLKQDGTGILDTVSALGNAVQYNKQYSAENTLRPTFTKILGEESITSFDNRIAYSATSIEGERFDAYRLFLPANYHDIPKQHGKITGLFVHGNDLMIHTERCLWRAFFNTLATQATSAGDIVLGNGGAFNRPSIPMVTVEGGYAGCKDISASIATPNGRYFFDTYKAKLFYLSDGLKEISNPVVFKKLRDLAYGKDAVLGYDYERKRILISSPDITLSYKPELNSFDGRHTYKFDHFISRDIKDYLIADNKIRKFDTSKVGVYFNGVENSKLVIQSVVSPLISKRYTSLYAIITSKNAESKQNEPFRFFDTFKAYSRERNTGVNTLTVIKDYMNDLELLGDIFVYKANNKFRMAIPSDIVDDIEKDINLPTNLKTHSNFSDLERMYLPDMIDDHIVMEFVIDNTKGSIIQINSIIVNFEQNKD
ncbi:hypothetical protein [Tenacibaculum sp.]|uniref:hypothetical protein n=1 Tax=Tenacibaculum sp. TaxID=1906242 RepID=UPI003D09FF08